MRSRGISAVGLHGVPGRSPVPNSMVSNRADIAASRSQYSLPTVTGLTGLSGSEADFGLRASPVSKPSSSQTVDTGDAIYPQDVPLAIKVQQGRHRKRQGQKSILTRVGCLETVGPVKFLEVAVMKTVGYSLRK